MTQPAQFWYFAYGANMARSVLARRTIQPARSAAARLDAYRLCFNHPGLPPIEPVFANIAPAPGETVYGVAHLIAPEEAAILDSVEPGYHRVAVALHLPDGEEAAGFAYVSDAPGSDGHPSARYLNLLLAGAREHTLPAPLIATWEQWVTDAGGEVADPSPALADRPLGAGEYGLPDDLRAEWAQRRGGEPP